MKKTKRPRRLAAKAFLAWMLMPFVLLAFAIGIPSAYRLASYAMGHDLYQEGAK